MLSWPCPLCHNGRSNGVKSSTQGCYKLRCMACFSEWLQERDGDGFRHVKSTYDTAVSPSAFKNQNGKTQQTAVFVKLTSEEYKALKFEKRAVALCKNLDEKSTTAYEYILRTKHPDALGRSFFMLTDENRQFCIYSIDNSSCDDDDDTYDDKDDNEKMDPSFSPSHKRKRKRVMSNPAKNPCYVTAVEVSSDQAAPCVTELEISSDQETPGATEVEISSDQLTPGATEVEVSTAQSIPVIASKVVPAPIHSRADLDLLQAEWKTAQEGLEIVDIDYEKAASDEKYLKLELEKLTSTLLAATHHKEEMERKKAQAVENERRKALVFAQAMMTIYNN